MLEHLLTSQSPRGLMLEVAEAASMHGFLHGPGHWPRPGQFWEYLPPDVKKVLTNLKSDDMINIRWPPWDATEKRR